MEIKEKILRDIVVLYKFLEEENRATQSLYDVLNSEEIPDFLLDVYSKLSNNNDVLYALIDRIVTLRETSLDSIFDKYNISNELRQDIKTEMFYLVETYYKNKFQKYIAYINDNLLLTEFWRELFLFVFNIGICFNRFFNSWHKKLICGINEELKQKYNGNTKCIIEALSTSFEVGVDGEINDRSYSIPEFINNRYIAVAYCEFFKREFDELDLVFKEGLSRLENIDEVCHELEQKSKYLDYFRALRDALMQKEVSKLLESWREVDKKWLCITTPIQICHPFEYYEDHYRKSVSPEWDLRISRIYNGVDLFGDSNFDEINSVTMQNFYDSFFEDLNGVGYYSGISNTVRKSLSKTQIYGGLPMLFFGSELNGLFSAQVIPNDEYISGRFGKKIFYFPDRILELSRSKPFMLISRKTFSNDFLDFTRELLFFRQSDWYKVYEFSTIGHEFGHIFCVDNDSEVLMNQSGQFKNIEEFKATMCGLAYYFTRRDKPLLKEMVYSLISRCISILSCKNDVDMLPYYCECLIHLDILFTSGVINYETKFKDMISEDSYAIDVNDNLFDCLIEEYLKTYKELAKIYMLKDDADIFLDRYMTIKEGGKYIPIKKEVAEFVSDYYDEYCKIGQILDRIEVKEWRENYQRSKY